MADDLGERSEAPTGRRLGEARGRGKVPKSQDFGSVIDLIGGLVVLLLLGGWIVASLTELTRAQLSGTGADWTDPTLMIASAIESAQRGLTIASPFLVLMVFVALAQQFGQVGFLFTLKPLEPKLSKLNPISGFKRLISVRTLVKTGLDILKMSVLIAVIMTLTSSRKSELLALSQLGIREAWAVLLLLCRELLIWMLAILLILALLDLMYQRFQHRKELKMTKQQVKDERKSMEGDPQIKARRMKIGREMVMQRLRAAVPTADVVVTNPTHYAVALRYDADRMASPKVIAKGADALAFRIRELAAASRVPIVEKPPLARALYAAVEVGQEIPAEHYQAVAEILAYVYRMEGRAA